MKMSLLTVNNLHVFYGNIHALRGLSLEVNEGEIVSLIGANGAGKTTLLVSILNQIPHNEGDVTLFGQNTNSFSTARIVKMGMTLVPEGRRVFARSSVLDNLVLGAYFRKDNDIKQDMERMFTLFPRLSERRKQPAGTLSGGEQQMLAIARALMSRPKILLLDEPSMGLSPIIVKQIFRTIQEINRSGVTILLVEQNANLALRIANRGYVLETGQIVLSDTGRRLMANENVKKAYLGE